MNPWLLGVAALIVVILAVVLYRRVRRSAADRDAAQELRQFRKENRRDTASPTGNPYPNMGDASPPDGGGVG